jgi:hypothetical protein
MSDLLEIRELYAPGHFGNTYEAALPNEMAELLGEAKFWGFNRYSDWFDGQDLYNPYTKKHDLCTFNMPEAIWAKKFSHYETAARLGYGLVLNVTPNHVFSNEVTGQTEADKSRVIEGQIHPPFGQLVCPSKPGVFDLIIENHRSLFEDFRRRGLRLSAITGGSYDFGGCACDRCRPWIVTFGKLLKAIGELAGTYFGRIETGLLAWWWSDLDHQGITAWADREAPDSFDNMIYFLPYNESRYAVRPRPARAGESAFVHISYGESIAGVDDTYGHFGPTIAPNRLSKTVQNLLDRNARGFTAYSEGAFDDINKALVAGLGSGQFRTADEVLAAYAARYLGGDSAGWSEWLGSMGEGSRINPAKARELFDKLAPRAKTGWRLDQLHQRLRMFEADACVRARKEWDSERLRAADAFFSAKEHLYRQCWGLGLTRTIFGFYANVPDWFKEYEAIKASAAVARPGDALDKEAVRRR